MKTFKQFLSEAVGPKDLEDLTRKYMLKLWRQWKEKFPTEPDIEDPSYMEPEFQRSTHMLGPWIFEQIKRGNCIDSAEILSYPKDAEKCSTKVGRCYYNAVDFVMKNGTEYGDLAYAFFIDKSKLDDAMAWATTEEQSSRPFLVNGLEHAVIITEDNKIIDPTLGKEQAGDIVIFEKVPESVWRTFKYTPDDANYDARSFYDDYICNKIKAEKVPFDFDKWIKAK